ncbi:permease [Patescibacteria group bacterium]|nr:permease [Patescibacteria group bacterium]
MIIFGKKFDILLVGSLFLIIFGYLWVVALGDVFVSPLMDIFGRSVFDLINRMWWGVLIAIIFVGILEVVPREVIMKVLGRGGSFSGILRATLAGVLLDLCSHGILIVGMKLYNRGASLGQVMAFLIASPWNSLSLTFVLVALVGICWTLAFIGLSIVIAVISGLIFEMLVRRGVLPKNPNSVSLPDNYDFWGNLRKAFRENKRGFLGFVVDGVKGSKTVMRWIFFGVVLASLMRTFLSPESFEILFGPTVAGLGMTLVVATILEVCSEGSTPIAADILNRAGAGGNAFAFLMTGVSTDYTEIMSLKETTKSWKIALFLPLVTVPQVVAIAMMINYYL